MTWQDRLRYAFDNFMSKGTAALIAGLGILSLTVIVFAAAVVALAGIRPADGEALGFAEAAWASLMRTLDPGTMGGDTGWGFRLVMFGVTLGGVFVISTLIGVLTSGIEAKLEELRRGRSLVVEEGHTLILGWAPHVLAILSELVIANENRLNACVVVLAEQDKAEMEEAIRQSIASPGHTRFVCRSGSPTNLQDLEMVSVHNTRSIVVIAPQAANADAEVIKTVLAITNHPNRRPKPYHIVAELRQPQNEHALQRVGGHEVEIVLIGNVISRIIAQTCRQSGLSVVYTELLDFQGDEIYFQEEPSLVGRGFGQALLAYEDSAVLGLCRADGTVTLNPPMDTAIQRGDRIVAISEDDDTVRLSGLAEPAADPEAILEQPSPPCPVERTLILGWSWRVPQVVRELDHYVAAGSEVVVLADLRDLGEDVDRGCGELHNQRCTFRAGDTTDLATLQALDVVSFDHVIVMAYADRLEEKEADALTLITLLHLREIAEAQQHRFSIVSEMLDLRTRELAEVTRADDFIVSERLTSLLMSQIAENKGLSAVFRDLFDPEGSEVYLKPIGDYVRTGQPVTFYTVVESARRRGEVAMGYRLRRHSGDARRAYGVVINPNKSQTVAYEPGDAIIVLAEE